MVQEKQTRVNREIKSQIILLIDENGNNIGKISLLRALAMAGAAELDLVEVNTGEIPVCRIMDFGKWRYEQSKKTKKNKVSRQGVKEIKFRPNTGENDLVYRAKRVSQFIKEGNKVKLCVRFKGREIAHMFNTGRALLERFLSLVPGDFKLIGDAKAEEKNIIQWVGSTDD